MKQFDNENKAPTTRTLALAVVEASLAVTRLVRAEVRAQRPGGLSLTEVRALGALGRQPGASLSDLAEQLGVGMPTTSKLVEDLVTRRLVRRTDATEDRRRLALQLTPSGEARLAEALDVASARIATLMAPLSEAEKAQLAASVARLLELLGPDARRRKPARAQRNGKTRARGSRGRRP
jgi:DNA-binding MarR family transcriptional regulator